jgi:hypothetical protein
VRGRHLPEDTEPWDGGPQLPKKKHKPQPSKPTTRRKFSFPRIQLRRKWLLIPLILAASALIFNGAFWVRSLIVSLLDKTAKINVIREESSRTFYNRGDELADEAIYTNVQAIDGFIASGASYRMSGEFIYGYKDYRGTLANNFATAAQTDVEMSYNSETEVYKFVINNAGAETDEKLKGYLIHDGTYYIVKENGRTYVLSDIYGDRAAVDSSENAGIYNILTSYLIEAVIDTNWFDKQADAYHLWGGTQYDRAIILDNPGLLAFPDTRVELRTFQNKPVSYIYRNKDADSDIEYSFMASYYYDDIPLDNPAVSDYSP